MKAVNKFFAKVGIILAAILSIFIDLILATIAIGVVSVVLAVVAIVFSFYGAYLLAGKALQGVR